MKARAGVTRRVAVGFGWLSLLLLTVPAVSSYWSVGSASINAAWLLVQPLGLAYLGFCAVVALAFALRCRSRRIVLLLYAAVLFTLHAATDAFDLAQILGALAALAILVILVEVVRQNRYVYRDLKAAGVPLWRPMASALKLWSPALLLIAIGWALNGLLVESSLRAAYGSGFVDEYCTVTGDERGGAMPCTGLDRPIARSAFEPASLERGLIEDARLQVLALRKHMLAMTAEPAQWSDDANARETLARVAAAIRSGVVPERGLLADQSKLAEANDTALRLLEAHKARLTGAMAAARRLMMELRPLMAGAIIFAVHQAQMSRLQREIVAIDGRIAARKRGLHAGVKQANPALAMKDELMERLAGITRIDARLQAAQSAFARAAAVAGPATALQRRAVARSEFLSALSQIEPLIAAAKTQVFRTNESLALDAGLLVRYCVVELADDEDGHHQFWPCPADRSAQHWAVSSRSFRDSVELSIDAWAAAAEADITASLDAAGVRAFETGRMTKGGARDIFRGVPSTLGLKTPPCGINPFCSLANFAKRRAESTYASFRRGAEVRFANAVAKRADLGVLSAHEQLDLVRQELHENVEASRAWAHQSVDALFATTAAVSTVLTIWLVMVAIKSYLYVLALEIFHETGVSYVGFDRALAIQGRYEAQDGIEVPKTFTTPLLTFEVGVNQRKGIVLWKPWVAFLHRLLHWKWQMSRGSHSRQGNMHFPSRQGSIGVKWTLAPGEEVIVAFPNLLGFSENVTVAGIVSLRLSTILFGRYIFHAARCTHGEGLLLLSVPGNAVLADEDVHEAPLGRIKAFNRQARFRVSSERSWKAVFKDGFNLSRVDGDTASRGLVLVGSSTEGELRFQGLVRFAKTFMWPL